MKCGNPDCGMKAKFKCPDCGILYCGNCASISDYVCGCTEPPKLKELNH